MDILRKKSINLFYSNINGLRTKIAEVLQLAEDHDTDIIILNETKLWSGHTLRTPGYQAIWKGIPKPSRNSTAHAGTAILIKNGIPFTNIPLPPHLDNQSTPIVIKINASCPIHLATLYSDPDTNIRVNFPFLSHINQLQNSLLMADINSQHQLLGDNSSNRNGTSLFNFLLASPLLHIPTGPTRNVNGLLTTPDKILISPSLYRHHPQFTVENNLPSDHSEIFCSLPISITIETTSKLIKNYKKADWERYRNYITDNIQLQMPLQSPLEIENANQHLTELLQKAEELAVPTSKIKVELERLPPHIIDLIRFKRTLQRQYKRQPSAALKTRLNNQHRIIKQEICKFRRTKFENFCQEIADAFHANPRKFWRLTQSRKLKEKKQTIPNFLNGTLAEKTENKLHLFRTHLENIIGTAPTVQRFDQIEIQHEARRIRNTLSHHNDLLPEELNVFEPAHCNLLLSDITPSIIHEILKKKKSKATGPDKISYIALKHAPPCLFMALGNLFTVSARTGYVPKQWKRAYTIFIPKPGKDPHLTNNYRPITLTSCIAKLCETALGHRLQTYLEETNQINEVQAGFRQRTSTIDQIMRIVTYQQSQTYTGWRGGALFMDLSSAFDMVWHDGLLVKLSKLRLPSSYTRWIVNFLTNRTTQIKIEENTSHHIEIQRGVPQGAALSPLLYLLFVNDTPPPLNPQTELGLFADDTAYWTKGNSTRMVLHRLERQANIFTEWCRKWQLQPNPAKTQLILFYNPHQPSTGYITDLKLSISIDNHIIHPTHNIKYLGFILDSKLTFKPQIKEARKKSLKTIAYIRHLMPSPHIPSQQKILLYKSIIRSILTYGAPIYHVNTIMEPLYKIERYWLRHTFQRWTYSKDELYENINLEPINVYLKRQRTNYSNKALTRKFILTHLANRPHPHPALPLNSFECLTQNRHP